MRGTPWRSVALILAIIAASGAYGAALRGTDAAAIAAPPSPEPGCHGSAVRSYDVTALPIPISYNHWGDFDPLGQLFVLNSRREPLLEDVREKLGQAGLDTLASAIANVQRALRGGDMTAAAQHLHEEATEIATEVRGNLEPKQPRDSALARAGLEGRFDVSPWVEPLVLRAHAHDCVIVHLTNALASPVGFHVHGAHVLPPTADGLVAPGATGRFAIHLLGDEGARFFHSHADERSQTRHGLFGAIVAQPHGSRWLHSNGAEGDGSGAEGIIVRDDGPDRREYVVFYHDEVALLDNKLRPPPVVSPYGDYQPGSKAINLRTEPFYDRFQFVDALHADGDLPRPHDKSQAYGSYTYGDPGTFIPRGYVGDPTTFQMINAGPGQHHVHHLHGGGTRWRATPGAPPSPSAHGHHATPTQGSERIDVQNIGPGEAYTAEIEGGAGGIQGSVGDFLFHCHIVDHYVAGMASFWRVHNTMQPELAELPDRAGLMSPAVTSVGLQGARLPNGTILEGPALAHWIESQLPPRGVPHDNDASVWDWTVAETPAGPLYLGEPETQHAWPNYASPSPGERPALLFDPNTGRPSYPMLRPHLGARPPFAPGHGPAPYLGERIDANHPDGLCPPTARRLEYDILAVPTTVRYNARDIDVDGQIFIHARDRASIASGAKESKSLVIRANQGDCVDILFANALPETEASPSKVNMHIHLVRFDVQAADGVVTGFNYEQSVRPAASHGTRLASEAQAGHATLRVDDAGRFHVGARIGIGLGDAGAELRHVLRVAPGEIEVDGPLARNHSVNAVVSTEFTRYRWYADVELGMVYWHDHVDGANSWRRGLFGGLVVEPTGSQWCDPRRPANRAAHCGEEWTQWDGHVVDIVAPPFHDANRTFRELVLQFQDRACVSPIASVCSPGTQFPVTADRRREPASFNLRSEPLHARNRSFPLASWAGSVADFTVPQGDPATDVLEAYVGDPFVVRLVYAGQSTSKGVATFGLAGHRFHPEPGLPDTRWVETISLGISNQHNLKPACGAGGCARLAGDYAYWMTQPHLLDRGAWGIVRVLENDGALRPLPGRPRAAPTDIPTGPVRSYDVVALQTDVTFNQAQRITAPTKLFALAELEGAILSGVHRPEPLIVRALPGEIVEMRLTNRLQEPVTLHAAMLSPVSIHDSGIAIGTTRATFVPPGETRTYRWWADAEVGAAHLTSYGRILTPTGQPANHALDGLYGAIVIEPAGTTFTPAVGARADIRFPNGTIAREHVLLYASNDPQFESSTMLYLPNVRGVASVNYRSEPYDGRVVSRGVSECDLDARIQDCGFDLLRVELRNPLNAWARGLRPPETPLIDGVRGMPLIVRALGGAGDQLQVHAMDGVIWRLDPRLQGANLVSAQTLGPGESMNAFVSDPGPPGIRSWGTHRAPFAEAGAWGLFVVTDPAG